jgi:signal transduction histidine kinase
MGILLQSLGIGMGAVYLTENMGQLQAIFSYPDHYSLLLPSAGGEVMDIQHLQKNLLPQDSLILPLLYENVLLGFLTISRGKRDWEEADLALIKKVVSTISIAVALDRRNQMLYQQQKDFLARFIHQLSNPLSAIRTFAQLLWRRLGNDLNNQTIAGQIVQETIHLQELLGSGEVDYPLLLSGDVPKLLPATASIDPLPILYQVSAHAQAIAQTRNLQFTLDIPDRLPLIFGDEQALREVLHNLVDNALKYTPDGGMVQIGAVVVDSHLQITVQDTGVGIPESDLDKIFTERWRGEQTHDSIAGSGLGLAIVKDLLQRMGGSIAVDSQVGKGSKFVVSVPLSQTLF